MRILITYDSPNWAYHKNAKVLQKYLGDEFEIELAFDQDKAQLMRIIESGKYDLVFHQWYRDIDALLHYGLYGKTRCITQIATTSLFDESISQEGWQNHRFWPLIVAKNKELFDRLSLLRDGKGVALAYHVNDAEIFNFDGARKLQNNRFTVGFVGHTTNPRKGYSIVENVCKELNVDLKTIKFTDKFEYEKMPDFYKSVDCVVCASNMEGAPNPMIEASLVGTPILTTRVGQIQEMVIDGVNGLFIDRTEASLKESLASLMNNPELYVKISENAATSSRKWNDLALEQWRLIFRFCCSS
jgi:glycosyltransferase involved in cell wall biosynthesis